MRTNAVEWSGLPPAVPLPFADVPDLHLNGTPSHDKDDPPYRRPPTNRRAHRIPR